jgi:iron complex outermembrane recepter protein
MSCKRYAILFILASLAGLALNAQTQRPQTWAQDLALLDSLQPAQAAQHQDEILRVRDEVELWLKAHPESKLQLAPLPPLPLTAAQVTAVFEDLHRLVSAVIAKDSARPFHLGITEVEVSAAVSPLSPTAESITQQEMVAHNLVTATQAIDRLPGVEISRIASNRNEAAFMIRGFSSNGQVPLYLDGIPISVPYDGYIDLNRFLTSDIAEIQVARGFSSPLLGPNALGGSANFVTREPVQPFEGDATMGTSSGYGLLSSLRLGARRGRFLAQGTVDWLQADFIPLSGNFSYPSGGYAALTPGRTGYVSGNVPYPLTHEENSSYSRDEKWGGRVGYVASHGDEYVFSYINQKGQKGVPLYQGPNANAAFKNFWKWPYWNKNSYYFLSNTSLGNTSSVKLRVFYDQFRNSIDMYDNAAYNTMTKYTKTSGSGSEHSQYDDHSDGASAEFDTHRFARQVIGISGFFKDDTHKESGIYPGAASLVPYSYLAEFIPVKELRDQQTSTGIRDMIAINARLHITVGFSADHLNGMKAETYNGYNQPTAGTYANTLVLPYQCNASPTNTSYSGCTAHIWNYNPQASASYALSASDALFLTYADRGRFPTLKQRYSSGMGSALPNPDLKGERSRNWNIGYSHVFRSYATVEAQLFRSDLRDAIESALVPDTNGLCPSNSSTGHCSQNVNIGKETHQGVEFEVHTQRVWRISFDASYGYLNRTIGTATLPSGTTTSSVLVLPTGVPKNKAIGTATLFLPRHISGMVSTRYEGGVTLQDTTYSTAPRNLPFGESLSATDAGLNAPIHAGLRLQTGVKNLFDRSYFYSAGYPEAGRTWYFNLRYSLRRE